MKTKLCPNCKKVKPYKEFQKRRASKNKIQIYCKQCKNEWAKKYRSKVKNKYDGLHTVWEGMKHRCLYSKHRMYKYYGGKGIKICKEWHNNFLSFYEWAKKNGYKKRLTIDRVDRDKGYYFDNCRFITQKENIRGSFSTKLNIENVKEIRKLLKEGKLLQKEIANKFNVSQCNISAIKTNKNLWR